MEVLFNSFENDVDSWYEIQEALDSIDKPVTITGTLGLWDGVREIYPTTCNSLTEAFDRCIGRDIDDIILYLVDDSSYKLECYHHDGTNIFYIK